MISSPLDLLGIHMEISNSALISYQYHREETASTMELHKKNQHNENATSVTGSIYSMKEQFSLSITDGNQTLSFVYERAISAIQVEIEQISKDNPALAPYLDAMDYTPEATADRIVNFATGFFDVHKARHEEMTDQEALTSFMDIIGGAIDKGFSEARDILDSLNVLQGSIKENIDTTYGLVEEKLNLFKDSFSVAQ